MFQFDESFLEEVGLSSMPEEQKEDFLQYAQDQLETRIGERMSADLTIPQLEEFEKIIDNDPDTMKAWIESLGDYQNDDFFKAFAANSESTGDELVNDFVIAKWLAINCPQYQDIISETMSDLQQEITANQASFLAA